MKQLTKVGDSEIFRIPIVIAVLLAVLTSCAMPGEEKPATESAEAAPASSAESTSEVVGLSSSAAELAVVAAEEAPLTDPIIYKGTDRPVRVPAKQDPVKFIGDDVSLNFEQAPLGEVVHAIMWDILGLDYVIDHPIQGQVTLRSRTPVPRDQLLGILESLLKSNGSLLIRGTDGRYLVSGSAQAARLSPSVSNPRNRAAGYNTSIVPLQYISASAMAEILRPLAEETAFVRIDNARNVLMLAGTRAQMDGWMDIISTFDVDMLAGMSVGLFPLESSTVEEVQFALNEVLSGSGGEDDSYGNLVRIIPFKRLNSLLVVTPRSHYLSLVGKWIERLDEAPDSSFEKRLYVYPVQNTTAGRLAELLTGIYSGGSGVSQTSSGSGGLNSGNRGSDRSGVAPGLSQETIGSSSSSGSSRSSGSSSSSFGSSRPSATGSSMTSGTLSTGDDPAAGGVAIEDVRVVADDENNSLMIYATGRQYKLIKSALEKLDVVATQVIIEASILEVTLTDRLKYGLEWTFSNGLGNDYDGVGVLAAAAGGPAAAVPGFSYTVTNSIGDISAVLNALSEESLINVISTPSVMVLDNHDAYIHVGDQVPVLVGQSVTDGGTSTQNIQYRDTGVKLNVRPSVNAGALVTMDIEQEVTDVGEIDSATGQRSFLNRNIMSRVAVRSGESVVLGGLIRENGTETESGVPILHTLPFIGPLFGTVTNENRRTELLVIITPRALYSQEDLRQVGEEMRSQVRFMELIEDQPD
ncbi:MAG: type II secretion system secretin GspD [Halieaceae bacterium]